MTARFGRNKRRRAREEISHLQAREADLVHSDNMHRSLLHNHGVTIAQLRNEIETAKDRVGRFCSIFPVDEEAQFVSGPARNKILWEEPNLIKYISAGPADTISDTMTIEQMSLDVLLTSERVDMLKGRVHMHVQFGDGKWAYGVDGLSARNMSRKDLTRQLSGEIAMAIANDRQRK